MRYPPGPSSASSASLKGPQSAVRHQHYRFGRSYVCVVTNAPASGADLATNGITGVREPFT